MAKLFIGQCAIAGVNGLFKTTIRGAYTDVHHFVDNKMIFVGSVSRGIYGDNELKPTPNKQAVSQIEELIDRYCAKLV